MPQAAAQTLPNPVITEPKTAMEIFESSIEPAPAAPAQENKPQANQEPAANNAAELNGAADATSTTAAVKEPEKPNESVPNVENKGETDEKNKAPDQVKEKFERHWDIQENDGQANENAPSQEVSKQKDLEIQLNELKGKESQYDELLNDELIKAIHTGRKAGKDVGSILKELSGVDADALSMEQLYESKLKRTIRLTAEEEKAGKTLEDIVKEEMALFKDFSRAKKVSETEDERERIKKADAERFAKYSEGNQAAINKNNEWRDKTIAGINQFADSVKGKKYFGVTMTESIVEKVKQMMTVDFSKKFYNPDGSYNTKFSFERSFEAIPELRKLMWDTAERNIRADEREKILAEFQRSDSNTKPSFAPPPPPDKTPKEAMDYWDMGA